jgi:hypothetical protein
MIDLGIEEGLASPSPSAKSRINTCANSLIAR